MTSSHATIEASSLTVRINGRRLFTNFSLQVAPGEIVALVGANGSGKTSLLNVFSALLRPAQGEVRLYGRPIGRSGPASVATLRPGGVARSFQVPFLQGEFNAWMNVRLGERIARAAGSNAATFLRNARNVFESLGLDRLGDALVGTLSLGQRRRVELARVFATRAGLLLLDEPFANLDATGVETVGLLLREAADRGAALLIVEHRQEAIGRYCDSSFSMPAEV